MKDASEVIGRYERAIAALNTAVSELAALGVPLARLLKLTQAAYDRRQRATVDELDISA